MISTNHRDVVAETTDRTEPDPVPSPGDDRDLAQSAQTWAQQLVWLPATRESAHFAQRLTALNRRLDPLLAELDVPANPDEKLPEDLQWLRDNVRLVRVAQSAVRESASALRRVPHVRTPDNVVLPRVLAIAQDLLDAAGYRYSDQAFTTYVEAFQTVTGLNMSELSLLIPSLKLVALEEFTARAEKVLAEPNQSQRVSDLIGSLRELAEAPWKDLLEPLIVFERVLAADPAQAYARMDFASRELYRHTVAHFADHSDCSELEIAQIAIDLSQRAAKDHAHGSSPGVAPVACWLLPDRRRRRRVAGPRRRAATHRRASAGFPAPPSRRVLPGRHRNPHVADRDRDHDPGVQQLQYVSGPHRRDYSAAVACSQSAVEVMNYLTTALLRPRILPKLDFSDGIPDDCVTMVAVPTLLLNEKQVRRLVEDLEVRYLGNIEPQPAFCAADRLARLGRDSQRRRSAGGIV